MSGSGDTRLPVQNKTGLSVLWQSGFGVKLGIEKVEKVFQNSENTLPFSIVIKVKTE